MIGSVHGNGLGAIAQEQPAMAELATQNQALEQKNAALEKQQAAMSLMIQELMQQNARLAAANAGGSALLKETVQQLDNGQMARDAEIELLRQENTLLKAQQEEANAQHADELLGKDGLNAQLERRVTQLEARQGPYQELTQSIKEIASTPVVSDYATLSKGWEAQIYRIHDSFEAAIHVERKKAIVDLAVGLTSAVAKINEELLKVEKEELKALNENQAEGGD
jgi:uncharacterized coiled-coil protein SlyX